ncbi:MAG: phage tail tape measure protein [Zoogloeaceae bacterium]|jgi:TP901 family phage tail tape measure protein|nr:phage tail tape measure protein [Zoogloeaceae bacterium]
MAELSYSMKMVLDAKEMLSSANEAKAALQKTFDAASKSAGQASKSLQEMEATLQEVKEASASPFLLNDSIKEVEKLHAQWEEARAEVANYGTALASAASSADLARAREALNIVPHEQIKSGVAEAKKAFETLKASGTLSAKELAQANLRMLETQRELNAATNGWVASIGKMKLALAGFAAEAALIGKAIKVAIGNESALNDLNRFADFETPEALEDFRETLQDIARETGFTVQELAKLSTAGAQLGLPTTELAKFAALVAKMGVAFGMSAEDAGAAMGKLAAVFRLSVQGIAELGDQINHLADNIANVAENELLLVTQQVGGIGQAMGLSAKEIAGFGAAMLSLGKSPEQAATALNSLFAQLSNIQNATPEAIAALKDMDINVDEFAAKMRTDPIAAIEEFLAAANRMGNMKLAKLGQIVDRGSIDDVAALSGNLNLLKDALAKARDEAAKGGVMANFEAGANTTQAALDRMMESLFALADSIGKSFSPVVRLLAAGIVKAADAVDYLYKAFGVLSPILLTGGSIYMGLGSLRIALAALTVAFPALATATNLASAAMVKFGAASKAALLFFVTNPIGLAITGVAAAIVLLTEKERLYAEQDAALSARLKQLDGNLSAVYASARTLATEGFPELAKQAREAAQAITLAGGDPVAFEALKQKTTETINSIQQKQSDLAAAVVALEKAKLKETQLALKGIKEEEEKTAQARIDSIGKVMSQRQKELQDALGKINQLRAAQQQAAADEASIRMSTADKIRERRRQAMTEEEADADRRAEAIEKIALAQEQLTIAQQAAAAGDMEGAERAAQSAQHFAEAAQQLGGSLGDVGQSTEIIAKAGGISERAAHAVGEAAKNAGESARQAAKDAEASLKSLQQQIDEITQSEAKAKIEADISSAEASVASIKADLESIVKTYKATVKVVYVDSGGGGEAHATGGMVGISRFARGGRLPGYGGGDKVKALLEAGEYVIRKERTARFLPLIKAINSAPLAQLQSLLSGLALPKFKAGGIVRRAVDSSLPQRFATGGMATSPARASQPATTQVVKTSVCTIVMQGAQQSFEMVGETAADALTNTLKQLAGARRLQAG